MVYLKGTEQECLDYDNQVTQGEKYQGVTKNWANPIEIEGSWYILKHEKYNSDLEVVNELPEIKQEETE
jgi:hypothetical protein